MNLNTLKIWQEITNSEEHQNIIEQNISFINISVFSWDAYVHTPCLWLPSTRLGLEESTRLGL